MNRTLLGVAVTTAVAAAVLTLYVMGHPYIPQDATVERDVQATDWGPLVYAFRFYSWIGDAKGLVVEVVIFFLILLFNRRAWLFAAGATLTGGWYAAIVNLVHRPRPTVPYVYQVTEHPGASSYPSGHTMFVVTVVVVLMVCFGHRFLPRWGQVAGWSVAVLLVAANAIGRMYTGAHWPSDVLGGILIAVFWLSLLASIRRVYDLNQARPKADARGLRQAEGRGRQPEVT
jgi:undecaprenyl-diphosphatase